MPAFVATRPRRSSLLLAVAALALAVALVLVGGRAGSAAATGPIDASGTWDIQLANIGLSCGSPSGSASVMQSGTSISFDMTCVGEKVSAGFDPSGTIDTTTGAFTASQSDGSSGFSLTGTVDKSGDGMSGSWTILFSGSEFAGTFTGSRQSSSPTATPAPPTDTPVVPPAVGGIAADPDLGALALETGASSSNNTGLLAGIVAAAATGVVALGWCRFRGTLQKLSLLLARWGG